MVGWTLEIEGAELGVSRPSQLPLYRAEIPDAIALASEVEAYGAL
jgi:hypothetical protein